MESIVGEKFNLHFHVRVEIFQWRYHKRRGPLKGIFSILNVETLGYPTTLQGQNQSKHNFCEGDTRMSSPYHTS